MSGDVTLTCRDCGQGFTFTAGEQDFYASRGFSEPSRCPDCRAARRAERDRGSYSSGGGYESSAPRAPRQMYEAVCTGCGNIASVPFQPSADKPVYSRRASSSAEAPMPAGDASRAAVAINR
jgi:CxxC-x17-CxxC domain-containing protein